MTMFSLDINATRVCAVTGIPGGFPFAVPLEPPHQSLPMVLALHNSHIEVGMAGLLHCVERPHQVYRNFLGQLRADVPARGWWRRATRSAEMDSRQALTQVFQRLQQTLGANQTAALALPPYLSAEQVQAVGQLARESRWHVAGSVVTPLAVAVAAHAEQPWAGSAIVIDVDDQALWLSVIQEADGQAHLTETYAYPQLALRCWKTRLLNALADCCILQSRRDPRQSASAEQALYMQLDSIMECCLLHRPVNVAFQLSNWFQHFTLQPENTEAFCASLTQQLVAEVSAIFQTYPGRTPSAVLLTAQAAQLPGLAPALEQFLTTWTHLYCRDESAHEDDSEDFGDSLLQGATTAAAPRLVLLPFDAAARGTHLLASAYQGRDGRATHLNAEAPLPAPQPLDAGPARLHFQGRDYLLHDRNFTIGRRYDCDIVLERDLYPAISPWHCEIVHEPRRYLLHDLSREGTWLNNQPVAQPLPLSSGDWIRLGPDGPLLRFLGQPEAHSLVTTA